MNFGALVLPERLTSALNAALRENKLSHAVLLEGASAETRLALAKQLAAALICTAAAPSEKPCLQCANCKKLFADSHPDVKLFSGGEKANSFHAEDIRSMRADAFILPNEAQRKVYILEQVSSLSVTAQNALLKLLEEPPDKVCFILLCANRNSLLATVLSRVSCFALSGQEEGKADPRASEAALRLSGALTGQSEFALLQETAVFAKDKDLLRAVLPLLREMLCTLALYAAGATAQTPQPELQKLAGRVSCAAMLRCADVLQGAALSLDRNENYNLLITRLCSELWHAKRTKG